VMLNNLKGSHIHTNINIFTCAKERRKLKKFCLIKFHIRHATKTLSRRNKVLFKFLRISLEEHHTFKEFLDEML
jgi:hypothetical protein